MRARRGAISAEMLEFLVSAGLVLALVGGVVFFVGAAATKAGQRRNTAETEYHEKLQQHDAEQTIEVRERTSKHASTFTHDNHWWVRTRAWSDYIVHHPGCPCQKLAEAE